MDHIPKIKIRTINPASHRYLTCGDWQYDKEDDVLTISVSKMPDWRSELAVAIHEAMEAVKCLADDITTEDVDEFDFAHQHDEGESGDNPEAPYHKQHKMAETVEREVAKQLDLDWETHDKTVNEA